MRGQVRTPPKDLEAVTRAADDSREFFAISSAGRLYHLRANAEANSVELIGEADLPNPEETPQIEAFDLQYIGSELIAM